MAGLQGNGRIRVLTLVDGIGNFGGAESLARQVTMRLDRERFQVTICVSRWEPDEEFDQALDELRAAGVEFLGLERESRFAWDPWRRFRSYIREHEIDVVHAHKFGSNFWAAIMAPSTRRRALVTQEHGSPYTGRRMMRMLDRELIARRADVFVTVSHEEARRMVEVHGIPAARVRVVPNGITGFDPAPAESASVRRELGIAPDQPAIGVVATLRPEKALEVFVRALARLRERFPTVVGVVAGGIADDTGPSIPDDLRRLSEELGVADALKLVGRRGDVPRLLGALDVGVLCSDREASPQVLLEYMEAGLPIVATRVGGIPELVDEGVTGYLVPARNDAALADAVGELLSDRDLARRMGEAGQARRRADFTLDGTVRNMEALYEELMARRSSP
jgi:glycosyltransferase involved in cell wall biosynthesis